MKLLPLGNKALGTIQNLGAFNVWEGSVRSMKTITSLIAWVAYVMRSPENVFLMSGATLGTISRNCIDGDYGLIELTNGLAEKKVDSDGSRFIKLGKKKIYYCGSDNARSFSKIRGMTIGGWYADEINLHHQGFVVEAINRSTASTDRVNMWTLNPEPPDHWIYKTYVDKFVGEPWYRWHHFTLDDNPAITEERKEELKSTYPGVFYQRYILGLRVRAEGAIYKTYDPAKHRVKTWEGPPIIYAEIGADIGGNKSATTYVCVGYYKAGKHWGAVALDEVYDQKNQGTEEVVQNFLNFVEKCKKRWIVNTAYIDSAEQLIIKTIRSKAKINIFGSKKKEIIDRIRLLDMLITQERFHVTNEAPHVEEAIQGAMWDDKAGKETRFDDGTSNIDSLDALEYSLERHFSELGGY